MAERTVEHATPTIEREYNASPAQVFAARANEQAKKRWFADGEDWETLDQLGAELARAGPIRAAGRSRDG